jgi:LytR cell envelope-related transcriptional attenuator
VHNARGAVLFELGHLPAASQAFEKAIFLAPGGAHFYNNLGLVQLRNGEFEQAAGTLLKSLRIEADNVQATTHWHYALSKLGDARAQVWLARRARLESPLNGTWDVALAPVPAPPAKLRLVDDQPSATVLNLRYPRQIDPPVVAAAQPEPAILLNAPLTKTVKAIKPKAFVRLKVVNGVGKPRAAQRFSQRFSDDAQYKVVKVGNHQRFDVQQTQIFHRPGFRREAVNLGKRMGYVAQLTQSTTGSNWDLMIVLGSDGPTGLVKGRLRS